MKIMIDGVIGAWDISAKDIADQLNDASGDVEIVINSGGGSVFQGVTIFNAIKAYNKGTVTVTIVGMAASIASYIALAADVVKAYDNTTYMIHNAMLPAYGNHNDLRKSADICEGLSSIIANAYVSKTSKSKDEIKNLMDDETFYYGSEMLDAGFVDEIISTESNTTKAEAKALTLESLKACANAINQNEILDLEAVAKLIPTSKNEEVRVIEKVVDLSAQLARARALEIKEFEC